MILRATACCSLTMIDYWKIIGSPLRRTVWLRHLAKQFCHCFLSPRWTVTDFELQTFKCKTVKYKKLHSASVSLKSMPGMRSWWHLQLQHQGMLIQTSLPASNLSNGLTFIKEQNRYHYLVVKGVTHHWYLSANLMDWFLFYPNKDHEWIGVWVKNLIKEMMSIIPSSMTRNRLLTMSPPTKWISSRAWTYLSNPCSNNIISVQFIR